MSRPRKNFFIPFQEFESTYSKDERIGDTVLWNGEPYTILKLHPKRGGVTARKA